ncbi:hypothetical protein VTJ49DRAFT_2687 [Mycothermus thermophilus]|uniref:AAA+ ATPase domain-containing protein n=1 Tax=Humicola insolens TaxID=85995 RepID=A0ABR3V984_HUMIN
MATSQDQRRSARLYGLFRDITSGKRRVQSPHDARLFLEAVRNQQSPSKCAEILVSSPPGLDAVRDAVRVDVSQQFIVSHTLPCLRYLADPGVKALADGQLLAQLLLAVAHPPTVLDVLIRLFEANQIPNDSLYPFAWLSLEIISLPPGGPVDATRLVDCLSGSERLLKCEDHEVRDVAYRIKKAVNLRGSCNQEESFGRHDNDHADFKNISILPTPDEFLCTQRPFYRTMREVFETAPEHRARSHIDNCFRLLREDMLADLRESIQIATGKKKGKRRAISLSNLVPVKIENGDQGTGRYKNCTLLLKCFSGLSWPRTQEEDDRRKFLKDNPHILRHQAFGVVFCRENVIAFASIERDIDKLIQSPPVLSLQITDHEGLGRTLLALTSPGHEQVQFLLIDTPVFAYEPVLLELQRMTDLPLLDLLINPAATKEFEFDTPTALQPVVDTLNQGLRRLEDGAPTFRLTRSTTRSIDLDQSQLRALLSALTSPITLIQGPPGTGKSFIGAEIAFRMHKAGLRIAVFTFTNHALDQFIDDLQQAGIPMSDAVRIGSRSKCSDLAASILLSNQNGEYRRSHESWSIIEDLRSEAHDVASELQEEFQNFTGFSPGWDDLCTYLEFTDGGHVFLDAFRVPDDQEGWSTASKKKNKVVGPGWLFARWIKGDGPGFLADAIPVSSQSVWKMPKPARAQTYNQWLRALREERLDSIKDLTKQGNDIRKKLDMQFSERDAQVLRAKNIICCTTTAAAKYSHLIRAACPDVVMMEEAGEILESHTLTALTSTVKQLVLIGDHKQLRPKINNYSLSVEKGDGFDLNCSMFERLIKQGMPHVTLTMQHRMVPEISAFPRALTYPELVNGPKTSGRPEIRGLRDRVIFVNHNKPEDTDRQLQDRRDLTAKASRKNQFEAEMALACVKYLGQQGYPSDRLVVLTPYLGQLRVLRDLFKANEHDPTLSDMDKKELIQAGLMSEAAASLNKEPLRISTIDNYQGEESDIVIASLTRSNDSGDIGFMAAPERVNVLITRARDGIILIGNMATFLKSKKGRTTWYPFFDLLKEKGHLYDGLPVHCEKHRDRTALLKEPNDFARFAPDGGCTEPCNAPLKCGIHKCLLRCHRVVDHSMTECRQSVSKTCDRQHKTRVPCARRNDGCQKCIAEDKETERRMRRDLNLEMERRRREEEYTRQLRQIQDEIEHQRMRNKYEAEQEEREKTLEQHRRDLEALKDAEMRLKRQNELRAEAASLAASRPKTSATGTTRTADGQAEEWSSDARAEWEHLKQSEGAMSVPMDKLMQMIGLEEVKQEFLAIKSNVDTALRQGIKMSEERYSCKTTVARLYAQFLTELCVIPGSCFKETTGAALANAGVSGTQSMVQDILDEGGGVLFIDEAYQLTSGNNHGGGAVLDYLLTEVENLRGKVVFVLAGYNKQMETFFAHNPGLPSRFPVDMKFADYTDAELLKILELKVNNKYGGRMECEDGLTGLYCRIVTRRIGQGRGKEGFGNARTVENVLDRISKRQADRLRRERKAGQTPNDFFFTKEDLIGPEPSAALAKCDAWKELQGLIGLAAVKEAVKSLVSSIEQNYQRELAEEPLIQYSLNKVFLGNPGTGKTTVAKLYGRILVALGLLSKGEVVIKTPADFVGSHLGQSEQNTKGILASTVGKVLVIDEAYGLYGGGDSQGTASDPYKTAVIDTIVAEVQSVPGDDRCVLLLGYKEQMEKMFQNVNPGLSRRFPIASGFTFEDFTDDQLRKILDMKIKKQGYEATDQATNVAMEMLMRARNRPNFGNAGEVDILLDTAKSRHQTRFAKGEAKSASLLEARDFDEDFDRAERTETNVRKLFEGTVGSEQVVSLLEGYQQTVRTMKALELDPKEDIPFNFLFRGPPGTGKTTTARKMGKVFYDMGFLASAEVVECSAADLIGQYVGQTGPKVQQLLEKALGRVLFVDEAYRLAEGHFAREAMDEIVDCVTKDRYFKKLVIIFAGYEDHINRLMSQNPGLTSRFPEVIDFQPLTAQECMSLLLKLLLQKQKGRLVSKSGISLDLSCLEAPSGAFERSLIDKFTALAAQDNWASARDVQTIANGIFKRVVSDQEAVAKRRLVLTENAVTGELDKMLSERASRAASTGKTLLPHFTEFLQQQIASPEQAQRHAPPADSPILAAQTAPPPPTEETTKEAPPPTGIATRTKPAPPIEQSTDRTAIRDAGVSDEVWEQLQRDKQAALKREAEVRRLKDEARKASDAAREEILRRLIEEEERRLREEEAREKLKRMGKCPMGYEWIRQAGVTNDLAAKMGFPERSVPLGFYPEDTPMQRSAKAPYLVEVAPGIP